MYSILWSMGDWSYSVNSKRCRRFYSFIRSQSFKLQPCEFVQINVVCIYHTTRTEAQPLVCSYMKGLQKVTPSFPNYSFTWDACFILENLIWARNSLKVGLSWKLASLLSVLFEQNATEISSLVIDIRNFYFEKDIPIIRIRDLLKTPTKRFHAGK